MFFKVMMYFTISGGILSFLSSNLTKGEFPRIFNNSIKEGYLSKKGKSLGVWIARYYVLFSDRLEYFDTKVRATQKPSTGSIDLQGSKISRNKDGSNVHTILIETASNKKIFLCAESAKERDDWIFALAIQIECLKSGSITNTLVKNISEDPHIPESLPAQTNSISDSIQTNENISESIQTEINENASEIIQTDTQTDMDELTQTDVSDNIHGNTENNNSKYVQQKIIDTLTPMKTFSFIKGGQETIANALASRQPIFGVPLSVSVSESQILHLPSIVYRCIEFLEAKKSYLEEGIYRVNGSSSEIAQLKSKFEKNGDVNLLSLHPPPDTNSVAGLLKLFFRELDDVILTVQLQPEFHKISEMETQFEKYEELTRLVSLLPVKNDLILD